MNLKTIVEGSCGPLLRTRVVAWWVTTLAVAFENAAGAMWTFLPLIPTLNRTHAGRAFAEYLSTMLTHLGYPHYFRFILGPWQLGCAAILFAPRFRRLKEWAYAGAFFNYSSAVISHWFVGDGLNVPAVVFLVLTVTSAVLRPVPQRLDESGGTALTGELSWVGAALTLVLLLVLSLIWLPKSPG